MNRNLYNINVLKLMSSHFTSTWVHHRVIYKALHRKLKFERYEPNDNSWGELRCYGRVDSFCSTCGTRRVSLVTNPMTQTFRNGKNRSNFSFLCSAL
jgi:hypothetical protein